MASKGSKSLKSIYKNRQMSDTFINAIFLTLSGGFQDAYTYLCRGKVFANAQTGNIVLMSTYLFSGKTSETIHYLIPVISFVLGICAAEVHRIFFKNNKKIHWRQLVLIGEILILAAVGFIPGKYNLLANALVSFVAAMQVQTFRKISGNSYASTMCIGNIRSGAEALCGFIKTGNKKILLKSAEYFGIILLFAIGAGIGGLVSARLNLKAIFISCVFLAVSFLMMFKSDEEQKKLDEEVSD